MSNEFMPPVTKRQESTEDKGKIVASRYRIEKRLGKNKDGNTFLALDLKNNEEP
jgi:hypothetical protein